MLSFLLVAMGLLLWPAPPARAAAGDEWVTSADSRVSAVCPSPQQRPDISGDTVVWQDQRGGRDRIFMKKLSSREPERVLDESANYQSFPVIDGNLVVWERLVSRPGDGLAYQVEYMRLGEGCPGSPGCTRVVPGYLNRWTVPAVSGSRIVWADIRNGSRDVIMFDVDSGAEQVIAGGPGDQVEPAIDGNLVAWIANSDYSLGTPRVNDLYVLDLDTGMTRQLTFDAGKNLQQQPAVSGSRIAFRQQASLGSPDKSGIWIMDLAEPAGAARMVSHGNGAEINPDIDGDLITWEVMARTDVIWLQDLSTGVSQKLSQATAYAGVPAISGSDVVWQDDREGLRAIYHNRLGDRARTLAERYRPELHFRHDINGGSRDDFEPRTVDILLDVPGTRLLRADGDPVEGPTPQTLAANTGGDNYLDLPGSPANPLHDYAGDYLGQLGRKPDGYPVTAYSRVVPNAEGSGKTAIQYWLCYYYNNWYNNHEGDWEMVEVILDGGLEPEIAAYSQHAKAFRKYWQEDGLHRNGTHPIVYVAEGSHANYFGNGFFRGMHTSGDQTGDRSSTMPAIDMQELAGGWAAYAGHWGQPSAWYMPHVDSGPPGPAFQPANPDNGRYPWQEPLGWAGVETKGYDNDVIVEAGGAEPNLYDSRGNHTGRNAAGVIESQVPGSEYFERPGDGSRNIVVHNADVNAGLRLEIVPAGSATGQPPASLRVQAPDFQGNRINRLSFSGLALPPGSRAALAVTPAGVACLDLDSDGDGESEQSFAPGSEDSVTLDFTPPAAVTDLTASRPAGSSVTLSWTAPGDDGNAGAAGHYELRYSTSPITTENWTDAVRVGGVPAPREAGAQEETTVTGLDSGTVYYFAVQARDEAWQASPLSNLVSAAAAGPALTWSGKRSYWAGWVDYTNGVLTVDYALGNQGGDARETTIAASVCMPAAVRVAGGLPLALGEVAGGSARTVSLQYQVPPGTGYFRALTYASCRDGAGGIHWFPAAPPS